MSAPSRPVLRYHGSKWHMAPWIIEHFPEHRTYVEPFSGSASVLLRKAPSECEVLSDLDGEVVNVFMMLRDPETAERLREAIALTPYARDEFVEAYEADGGDDVERARRTIARANMAFSPVSSWKGNFRIWTRNSHSPAKDWARWPDAVPAFVERLRGVMFHQQDALSTIKAHDSAETLFYVDPPYVVETRADKRYQHDFAEEDHRALAASLHAARGFVVLSGYRSDLYDELFADWERRERRAQTSGSDTRTECLWLSPSVSAALHPKLIP